MAPEFMIETPSIAMVSEMAREAPYMELTRFCLLGINHWKPNIAMLFMLPPRDAIGYAKKSIQLRLALDIAMAMHKVPSAANSAPIAADALGPNIS